MAKFSQGFLRGISDFGRMDPNEPRRRLAEAAPQYQQMGTTDPLARRVGSLFGNLGVDTSYMQTAPERIATETQGLDLSTIEGQQKALQAELQYVQDPQARRALGLRMMELTKLKQSQNARESQLDVKRTTAQIILSDLVNLQKEARTPEQKQKASQLLKLAAVAGENAGDLQPEITALKDDIFGEKVTAATKASLLSENTQESVEIFAKTGNTSDLDPLPEPEKTEMTAFSKYVKEAGIDPASEEWRQLHNTYAKKLAEGPVNVLDPVKQMVELRSGLEAIPVIQDSQKTVSQAKKALTTIASIEDRMREGLPVSEQTRVVERTVSELYNADTRAQSEIDRFLTGRGIQRTFQEWISSSITGEPTKETIDNYKALSQLVEKFSKSEIKRVASGYLKAFKSAANDEVISNLESIYYVTDRPPSRGLTSASLKYANQLNLNPDGQ
jgi:hypothetical protein